MHIFLTPFEHTRVHRVLWMAITLKSFSQMKVYNWFKINVILDVCQNTFAHLSTILHLNTNLSIYFSNECEIIQIPTYVMSDLRQRQSQRTKAE